MIVTEASVAMEWSERITSYSTTHAIAFFILFKDTETLGSGLCFSYFIPGTDTVVKWKVTFANTTLFRSQDLARVSIYLYITAR
jgi:hypothetical protein